MTDKPGFFFDADPDANNSPAGEFFNTLQAAGVIQESDEPVKTEAVAVMRQLESSLLTLQFGVYEGNYAVHITPIDKLRNLGTEQKMKLALFEATKLLSTYVPATLKVLIHMPRPEWKMKVISFVVEGGATAWHLDRNKLEEECMPMIFQAVQKVIVS